MTIESKVALAVLMLLALGLLALANNAEMYW